MPGRRSRSHAQAMNGTRERLAHEAARMMAEGGIEDFGLAKRKAAERLGIRGAGALPTNAEIEVCLAERLRIFDPDDTQGRLDSLRRVAADVMLDLEAFSPRLVGAVLSGTVTIASGVELHVFADAPELVAAHLEQSGTSVRDCQRRYRLDATTTVQRPGFCFERDGESIEVFVFPERSAHQPPLSPIDQKPMRRAARGAVLALLAT
jgi:hypothetical protein